MVALSFVADVPQDAAHFPLYGSFRATLYVIRSAGPLARRPRSCRRRAARAASRRSPSSTSGRSCPTGFIGPVLIVWRLLTYYLVLGIGLVVAGHVLRQMLRGESPPPILDPDDRGRGGARRAAWPLTSGERP